MGFIKTPTNIQVKFKDDKSTCKTYTNVNSFDDAFSHLNIIQVVETDIKQEYQTMETSIGKYDIIEYKIINVKEKNERTNTTMGTTPSTKDEDLVFENEDGDFTYEG